MIIKSTIENAAEKFQKSPAEIKNYFALLRKNEAINGIIERGGFIAGGSVLFPFTQLVGNDNAHLTYAYYFHRLHGDVDFFFETQDEYDKSLLYAVKNAEIVTKSALNFAMNVSIKATLGSQRDSARMKLQLIHAYFGDPRRVIASFDLHNSMFAYDGTHIYYSASALNAEMNDEISISDFKRNDMPTTVWRVKKYVHRYGYEKFGKGSKQRFIDWLLNNAPNLSGSPGANQTIYQSIRVLYEKQLLNKSDLMLLNACYKNAEDSPVSRAEGIVDRDYYANLKQQVPNLALQIPSIPQLNPVVSTNPVCIPGMPFVQKL